MDRPRYSMNIFAEFFTGKKSPLSIIFISMIYANDYPWFIYK